MNTWIDYCGGRMFVVGYTEGGAPYGQVEWSDTGADGSTDGHRDVILDKDSPEPF